MTRFYDNSGGELEITMIDDRTGCAWERDFFECGNLPYDESRDAYSVDDVTYLVDYANDYMLGHGDFCGSIPGAAQSTLRYNCNKEV